MNQFKKAKQKAQESGKQTENITDIKTAGINLATINDTIESDNNINIEDTSVTIEPNISNEKTNKEIITNNTEIKNLETSMQNLENQDLLSSTIITNIKTVPEPAETIPILTEATITDMTMFQQATNAQPITYFEANANIIAEPKPELKTLPNLEAQKIEMPISKQATSFVPIPDENLPVTAKIAVQPELLSTPQIQEGASPAKMKNNKKNIPNIFTPKGESKSMRKSLVLKPTSVKIAENYCAKNGGSFNELIQTLLDNFIEEYGL